jgi:cobalt-zinc-cadmium efflux system outer membrane protein
MVRQAIALSAGLCLVALVARPQAAPPLTADQLVERALAGNREYLSAQERVRAALGMKKQAGVGIADSFEVSGAAAQVFGTAGEDNLTATYSHTFETFGKREKRVAAAGVAVTMAETERAASQRAVIHNVRLRYAELASARKKLDAIERLSGINQEYLRLTEARVEKGDAAPLEADLLRVESSRDQAQLARTQGGVQSALLELGAVLDDADAAALSISSSLDVPAFDDDRGRLKALALRNRPDLRLAQLNVEQAKTQLALAQVETKPNVTISGQYSHTDAAFDQFGVTAAGAPTPLRDHANSLGAGVSIPLTRAGRNRGNMEAAQARGAESELKLQYLTSAIPAQVDAAWQRWNAARAALRLFTQGVVDQSEKNLAVMRQAYTLGDLRLIDILNEQRRLLDTELSYIDAQADLFRAYADLEEATGGSLQ